uniref:Phage protein n=1 Tax=Rhabditophanes sp. KR3021 TaxID=114890 RepID=A0AC35THM0_9BILA
MPQHSDVFKVKVSLKKLFDREENFINDVIRDQSCGTNEITILKMKYQLEAVIGSIESILIRAFRPQIKSSDSEYPSFEEVLGMDSKLNRQVADLIINEFVDTSDF